MGKDDLSTSDSASAGSSAFKTVFLSYRFADQARFDVVQQIAVQLRFFSVDVVLDQRSLDYGGDLEEFMRREIRRADAIILVITEDYNHAILGTSTSGEGVRIELQIALQEKAIRRDFQVIPLLLDGIRPVAPLDRMKCAVPEAIHEVITQLGLVTHSGEARLLRQRYRIDRLIERRGLARIFHGWDMVADLPIEIYGVPPVDSDVKNRFDLFKRVVKGRSSAFSPFLLNIRDTYIDSEGGYYLFTERFEGLDLGARLTRGERTHPFGALCLAYQLCLALHELHSIGVIHGGLAPRCIRLNPAQTSCKIVDFEFSKPVEFLSRTADALEGYFQIMPPERFTGSPVSAQQDIYQVANLVLRVICGKVAVSILAPPAFREEGAELLEVEDPRFERRLFEELTDAITKTWTAFISGNAWLDERIGETASERFLIEELIPFLAWCLSPQPDERPRNCTELAVALRNFGVPPVGHLFDDEGVPVSGCLFSHVCRE